MMKFRVLMMGAAFSLLLFGVFWLARPLPGQSPLEVRSLLSVAEEDDGQIRVTLSGQGFDSQTQVSLLPDVGNQHLFRGSLSLPGMVNDMARAGDLLLLADAPDGLVICDISQPAAPSVVATLQLSGLEWRVSVVGSIALVLSSQGELHLVDISAPAQPALLSTLSLPVAVQDMACDGTRAYIAGLAEGLLVVDFSQPRKPQIMQTLNMTDRVVGVTLHGDQLLVAAENEGLLIYQVAAEGQLTLTEHLHVPGAVKKATLWNQRLLVQTGSSLFLLPSAEHGETPSLLVSEKGRPFSVGVMDDQVFIGTSNGVLLFRLDGASPGPASLIATTGSVRALCVIGDWLYVGDARTGLRTLPVPQVESLPEVNSISISDRPAFFKMTGNRLLMADRPKGLQIIDLSNNDEPVLLGELSPKWSVVSMTRGAGRIYLGTSDRQLLTLERSGTKLTIRNRVRLPRVPKALAVWNHSLLVADEFSGTLVFDLNNPDRPRSVDVVQGEGMVSGFAFAGQRVLMAEGTAGIRVAEMSPDRRLRTVHQLVLSQSVRDVAVLEKQVLVLYSSGQLALLHLEDNGRLRLIKDGLEQPKADSIAAGSDCFYLRLSGSGLAILQPSTGHPEPLVLLKTIPLTGQNGALRVMGDRLLVSDLNKGALLFSLTDPERPRLLQTVPLHRGAVDLLLDDDFLLVLNHYRFLSLHSLTATGSKSVLLGEDGWNFDLDGHLVFLLLTDRLQIIDIDRPRSLQVLSSLALPDVPRGIKVRDEIAYVACGRAGLLLVDLSDPSAPKLLGQLDTGGQARGVDLHGPYALIAAGRAGLVVADVSQPGDPRLLHRIQLASPLKDFSDFYDLHVKEDRVYIADIKNGLIVAELTADGNVRMLGQLQTYGNSRQLSLDGSRVYIADLTGGVVVADVSATGRPSLVGRITVPGLARQVEVVGGKLWVLSSGHRLYRMPQPVDALDIDLQVPGQLAARLPRPPAKGYYTLRIAGANGAHDIYGAVRIDLPAKNRRSLGRMSGERVD